METRLDRGDIQEKMESAVCECKCHVNGFQIPILLRSRATVVFIVQIIKKSLPTYVQTFMALLSSLTLVGYAMIWQSEVELIKNIYRKSSYLIFAKIFFPS